MLGTTVFHFIHAYAASFKSSAGWRSYNELGTRPDCKNKKTRHNGRVFFYRRRTESNCRIKVLQTSPLPLGYGADLFNIAKRAKFGKSEVIIWIKISNARLIRS